MKKLLLTLLMISVALASFNITISPSSDPLYFIPGEERSITVSLKNIGADETKLLVFVGGDEEQYIIHNETGLPTQKFEDVAAGATKSFSFDVTARDNATYNTENDLCVSYDTIDDGQAETCITLKTVELTSTDFSTDFDPDSDKQKITLTVKPTFSQSKSTDENFLNEWRMIEDRVTCANGNFSGEEKVIDVANCSSGEKEIEVVTSVNESSSVVSKTKKKDFYLVRELTLTWDLFYIDEMGAEIDYLDVGVITPGKNMRIKGTINYDDGNPPGKSTLDNSNQSVKIVIEEDGTYYKEPDSNGKFLLDFTSPVTNESTFEIKITMDGIHGLDVSSSIDVRTDKIKYYEPEDVNLAEDLMQNYAVSLLNSSVNTFGEPVGISVSVKNTNKVGMSSKLRLIEQGTNYFNIQNSLYTTVPYNKTEVITAVVTPNKFTPMGTYVFKVVVENYYGQREFTARAVLTSKSSVDEGVSFSRSFENISGKPMVNLIITNQENREKKVVVTETIPKSAIPFLNSTTIFSIKPIVLNHDPVVQWKLDLEPRETKTISYEVNEDFLVEDFGLPETTVETITPPEPPKPNITEPVVNETTEPENVTEPVKNETVLLPVIPAHPKEGEPDYFLYLLIGLFALVIGVYLAINYLNKNGGLNKIVAELDEKLYHKFEPQLKEWQVKKAKILLIMEAIQEKLSPPKQEQKPVAPKPVKPKPKAPPKKSSRTILKSAPTYTSSDEDDDVSTLDSIGENLGQ